MGTKQETDLKEVAPIVVPTYSEKETPKKSLFGKAKAKLSRRKLGKQKMKDQKAEKILRQTPSLLPFLQIYENHILLKEGVMEILQIESKDLYSKNDEDLKFLLFSTARFYRSYFESLKVIAMNFPSNTEKQKQYWLKKKALADDPLRIKFIDRKLFEFEFLERERTNREFFLFIYADNEQQMDERKKQVVRSMQQAFPLKELSIEKKQNVLFMLNNQNTKV